MNIFLDDSATLTPDVFDSTGREWNQVKDLRGMATLIVENKDVDIDTISIAAKFGEGIDSTAIDNPTTTWKWLSDAIVGGISRCPKYIKIHYVTERGIPESTTIFTKH